MAVIDSEYFLNYTGTTYTSADAVSLATVCAAVDAAVKRLLRPFHPEPLAVANCVLDAPAGRDLVLPIGPVRSVASVYYRSDANGLAANFTSDYLLDNTDGVEYQLLIDDKVSGYSRGGVLRRVGRDWSRSFYRPPTRLSYHLADERGSVLVNYTAGPTSTPEDIRAAACSAVTLLMNRRKEGAPYASESWNGRSQSLAGPFTAEAAVRTPDVLAMLQPYLTVQVA